MNTFYWLLALLCALAGVLIYARAEARKAERLAALKAELLRRAREQERYEKISDNVSRMADADVRERLRNLPRQ